MIGGLEARRSRFQQKAAENGGFLFPLLRASEPLRAIVIAIMILVMATAWPALPLTTALLAPAAMLVEVGQKRQTALLRVIETLVKRVCCIGDALEPCRSGRKGVGALLQSRDRIVVLTIILRILITMLMCLAASFSLGTAGFRVVDALFGEIAHRALHGRPALFLIGRELQARMNRCDTRIDERRLVLCGEARMLMTVLRVHRA
jgi:hypothetical protein